LVISRHQDRHESLPWPATRFFQQLLMVLRTTTGA
jgi:hypothetical protein